MIIFILMEKEYREKRMKCAKTASFTIKKTFCVMQSLKAIAGYRMRLTEQFQMHNFAQTRILGVTNLKGLVMSKDTLEAIGVVLFVVAVAAVGITIGAFIFSGLSDVTIRAFFVACAAAASSFWTLEMSEQDDK